MSEWTTEGRLRARLAAAILVGAAVVASGWLLERSVGPRPTAAEDVPDEVSGGWFCPHGGGGRWRTWIVVANPSDREATLRAVTYGSEDSSESEATVPAGSQTYLEVPADEMASGTAIEFFGGPVAAGMVSARDRDRGVAAEPCADGAGATWYLPEGTTDRGFEQRVVVMNPFAQRAVVNVTLVTEDERIRAGELTGIVLDAGRTTSFDLGEFALGNPTVAAIVRAPLGRVAAASVGVTDEGLRTALGVRAASRTWVLPGAGERGSTAVAMLAPGDDVPFRIRAQDDEEQVEVVGEADVIAGVAETVTLEADRRTLVVVADGTEPFVAARRLVRDADEASTAGAAEGGTRWVALPAAGPEGAPALLVVENPADQVAEVHLTLLTSEGRATAPSIERLLLPPGRSRTLPLEDLVGEEPVSVFVEAVQGVVVAAQAASSDAGYAVATGVRLDPLG